MVRSIWSGAINFGMVSIPVKLYTAVGREGEEKIELHLVHERDGERIRYERTCEKGHRNLDWDDIAKGYEYARGKWVEITDEDLDALDLPSLHIIDVDSFVPWEQIDPMYFDATYYVVPGEGGAKAYRLMTQALEDEGLVGVGKVAIRDRERLCTLRISDRTMVVETMHWPEEIRDAKFRELRSRASVHERERKMARQLIQQLSGDFDPSRFKDEYHSALQRLIKKKVKGQDIVVPEKHEELSAVVDLMEALRVSVDAAKRGQRQGPQSARGRTPSRTRRRSKDDLVSLGKPTLVARARRLGIQGRSKMTKNELARAIRRAS